MRRLKKFLISCMSEMVEKTSSTSFVLRLFFVFALMVLVKLKNRWTSSLCNF